LTNVDIGLAKTPEDHLPSWTRLPRRSERQPWRETKDFLGGFRVEDLVKLVGKAPLFEKVDDTLPILADKEVLEFIESLVEILDKTTGSKTFLRVGIEVETLLEIAHRGVG
jgi:hypothetical protein